LPYFSSGSARTASTTTTALYATTTYDALDRPVSVTTAAGTTAYAHDDWKTAITDPNGNIRRISQDAYGNLARVEEVNGSETYITAYRYDYLKDLTSITDAQSNVRAFTYDGLGRRLTAEDLHAAGDASYGTWYFAYDDAGNIASTTDPKSQNTVYAYDDINRPLTEDYAGTPGITDITYAYDSCMYGVMRLCGATTTAAGFNYAYDPLGRIKTERFATSTGVFTTAYTRDRQGNLTDITYPDGATVAYAYNSAGLLETVSKLEPGTTTAIMIVEDTDYDPTDAVAYRDFGNGTETVYTHDPNELYRLTNIRTTEHAPDESFGVGGLGLLALDEQDFLATAQNATGSPESATMPSVAGDAVISAESSVILPTAMDAPPVVADVVAPAPAGTGAGSASSSVTLPDTAAHASVPGPADFTPAISAATAPTDTESPVPPPVDPLALVDAAVPPAASSTPSLGEKSAASLEALLAGKSSAERAAIKGAEIARIGSAPRTPREGYDIEIVSAKAIPGGVEVYARAWDATGAQIGFGRDGTVDIERFRIINPPVFVDSPHGAVVRQEASPVSGVITDTRRLKQDPREALMQVLEHTLAVKKEKQTARPPVPGKIGRTTLVAYPAEGANPPADGEVTYHFQSLSWADLKNSSTGNDAYPNSGIREVKFGATGSGGTWGFISRLIVMFDTSSIGEGTVSAATFSLRGKEKNDWLGASLAISVYSAAPASTSTIVAGDYGSFGSTPYAPSVSYTNWNTAGYNDFSFNATGRAAINGAGVTPLGVREAIYDAGTSTPPWTGGMESGFVAYLVEYEGTTRDPKLVVEYASPNQAPTAPTDLTVEGQFNPSNVVDPTPEFSAVYNDPDAGDSATYYRLQVATTTSWTDLIWDTGTTTMATTTRSMRSPDISYAGPALELSTPYYWRIAFSDSSGATGAWSTATSTFMLAGSSIHIQDITYDYDPAGNITLITDNSASGAAKTVSYTYDGLNRLTSASTTQASSTPYKHTYTYSSLGNLTQMSTSTATTTYAYAGTGYANPHAPTAIGAYTLAYDASGNLTSYGP
jgi:YD repeat-containing protein